MPGPLEREIKLRFATPDEARRAVAALGATLRAPRRLQTDILLDSDPARLGHRRCALRVRTEATRGFITFKGTPQPGEVKVREELETAVDDPVVMLEVLDRLGFRPWFRYQKYREEYALGDIVVAIDETPIGTFVEIEGTTDGIHATATALGRGPADYILGSYRSLYVEQCERSRVDTADMLFEPPPRQ